MLLPSCRAADMAYPGEDYDNDVRGPGGAGPGSGSEFGLGSGLGSGF